MLLDLVGLAEGALKFLLGIIAVVVILIALTWFPWPTLPDEPFNSLALIVSYATGFNVVFPFDTLLRLGLIALTIEIALPIVRLLSKIVSAITGVELPTNYIGQEGSSSSGQIVRTGINSDQPKKR